jgi:hypothetical protein
MGQEETVYPNDTTNAIRKLIKDLEQWRIDNAKCDQRHTAMVITKLEEAELLTLRMVIEDQPKAN